MLERSNDKGLVVDVWESATAKVRVPNGLGEQLFAAQGPMPVFYDNKRCYHRYYMRGKSVLKRGGTTLGVYTIDVSRQGIGFLSPLPLLPKEQIELYLSSRTLNLIVARCRRLGDACFVCGGTFALSCR